MSFLRSRNAAVRILGPTLAAGFFALCIAGAAGATTSDTNDRVTEEKPLTIEEKWGVQIRGIGLTAEGHMLDFRYRVVDAQKAAPLFSRNTKPYLIHQETNLVLAVPNPPKVGPLRNSNPPKEGKVYWMFFGNPGKLVKPGNRVTVVIGDFRAENLPVE